MGSRLVERTIVRLAMATEIAKVESHSSRLDDSAAGSPVAIEAIRDRLLRLPLLGRLIGANFNLADADQAIPILPARYIVENVIVVGATISLTTVAGGIYTEPAKAGAAIVGAAQSYVACTAATKYTRCTLGAAAASDAFTGSNLYLNLTIAQGAAALADVFVFGLALPNT